MEWLPQGQSSFMYRQHTFSNTLGSVLCAHISSYLKYNLDGLKGGLKVCSTACFFFKKVS